MKPIAIDLFCGLGGWTEGLLAEGYEVYGFDIEHHRYPARAIIDSEIKATGIDFKRGDSFNGTTERRLQAAPLTGGWHEYPAQLILQDVMTIHGSQFRNAALIVASPPCQAYSRRAMPFGALWREHSQMDDDGAPCGDYMGKDPIFNHLFRACLRIQREASEAAGRHIPMVVENVKGAQPFIGRAAWKYGSFYLWGDVPALMVIGKHRKGSRGKKGAAPKGTGDSSWFFGKRADPRDVRKTADGEKWQLADGTKFGGGWWHDSTNNLIRKCSSRSLARKAASAQIAKIPLDLARHIARVYHPAGR